MTDTFQSGYGAKLPEQAEHDQRSASRRAFLSVAASSAAAGIALPLHAEVQADCAAAAPTLEDGTTKAFQDSLAASATRKDFSSDGGISGAQIFANLCKDQGLAALFLSSGNYTLTHEIAQVGIPTFGGHHEGAMASAADGFIRASGELAACSGTEGPGFTNMLTGVAAAHFSNTPLLVLASNRTLSSEDNYRAIQFMYQQNQTEGIRKYGKRITAPERIYEYGCYAFRNLKTGVPGPVHLDFPAEVVDARYSDKSKLVNYFELDQSLTESRAMPNPADVRKMVMLIAKAERPTLVAGHGVHLRHAHEALLRVAEKNDIAVISSGPIRGSFPDEHRLSLSLANEAMMKSDLVIFVGQYLMPNVSDWTFAPGVVSARVHPESEDIGRNWPIELGVVADEAYFLEALADALPRRKRDTWVADIAAAQAKFIDTRLGYYKLGLQHSQSTGALHPAVIAKELYDFLYRGSVDPKQTLTGYGGLTIGGYVGHWLRAYRPAQMVVTHYQLGAMGPEIAMMIGGAAAANMGAGLQAPYRGAPAFVACGDGGCGTSLMEIETAVRYKMPLVATIYNNNCWGSFNFSRNTPKSLHLHLFQENLRYDRVAEALGARGEYVHTPEDYRAALQRAYDAAAKERLSTVINCQGMREFSLNSAYAPGTMFNPEPGVGGLMH